MADYNNATRYAALPYANTSFGDYPGETYEPLVFGAMRSYVFKPDLNAGNRPTSGQIYPRGVR